MCEILAWCVRVTVGDSQVFFAAIVRRLLIYDQLPRLLTGFKLVYKLCTVISILMYAVEEPDTLPAGVKEMVWKRLEALEKGSAGRFSVKGRK